MVHIIIVAAGRGSRFGSELPKQFVMLGDRPVIIHTLTRLRRVLPEAKFTVVLSPDFVDFFKEACSRAGIALPEIALGGDTRAQSVRNALESISPVEDTDTVMVHDGARPVVPPDMLMRLCEAMDSGAEAAIPVIAVTDSLRRLSPSGAESEVADRSRLVAVQTPQAFRLDILKTAYRRAFSPSLTDDASLYQAFTSRSPVLVEGSHRNIKITHPGDLEVAALYMK